MKMRLKGQRTALLAVAAFVSSIAIAPAAQGQLSQLHPSFYGSAEWDTENSQFYLLGMYVGVAKLGWSPYLNVNGYHLRYEDEFGADQDLSAISPTLGLAYAGTRGGFSFGAGYTWVTDEVDDAPGAEGGSSDGVHVAFGAYRDGAGDRPVRTQFLSNYNFGAEYLWTRLRFSVPMTTRTRVGLELVGQGGFDDGASNTFKIGPTIEFALNDNFRLGGVVGYKTTGGDRFIDGRENAAYFKVEFSLSPF
jgi:hypothetical protein